MPVRFIPTGAQSSLPTCLITCDSVILPVVSELIALDVLQALEGSGSATLRLLGLSAHGTWDATLLRMPMGAALEVALGYGDQTQVVFNGLVSTHRLHLTASGAPELVLEASSNAGPLPLRDEISASVQYGATLMSLDAQLTRAQNPSPHAHATPRLSGQLSLQGMAVSPGALIALQGVGTAFGGPVRVLVVRHTFSAAGWNTQVEFCRP